MISVFFGFLLSISFAGELRFYESYLPTTLNPLYPQSMTDIRVHSLLFDRLFQSTSIDSGVKSHFVRWDFINATDIKLFIYKDRYWHDSKPITAEDICFTIDVMRNKKTSSRIAQYHRQYVLSCKVNDPKTAIVKLAKIEPAPLMLLNFPLLPKHMFSSTIITAKHPFGKKPVGSGVMRLKRIDDKGLHLVPHRKSTHHHSPFDSLYIIPSKNPLLQIKSLGAGKVHGITDFPAKYISKILNHNNLRVIRYPTEKWWFIALNQNQQALARLKVRRGLHLLINRKELLRKTVGSEAISYFSFISGPFSSKSPYYNRNIATPKPDTNKAEQLFIEAGLEKKKGLWFIDNQPITFRIAIPESLTTLVPDLLEEIGNQLKESGFKVLLYKIDDSQWGTAEFSQLLVERYDILIGSWSFTQELKSIFHTNGKMNLFRYSNTELDKSLQAISTARSVDRKKDKTQIVHAQLAEELPYLFLWNRDAISVWDKNIRNIIISSYFYFENFSRWKPEKIVMKYISSFLILH